MMTTLNFKQQRDENVLALNSVKNVDIALILGTQVCHRRVIVRTDRAEAVSMIPDAYVGVCQVVTADGNELAVAPTPEVAIALASYVATNDITPLCEVQPARGRQPTIETLGGWIRLH